MLKINYNITCVGLNFDRLLREFYKLNITIYNLDYKNYKTINFSLGFIDYLKLKKIKLLNNYKIEITKQYGLVKLCAAMLKHLALVITGLLCVIICFIFSNYTFKINVLGIQSISESEILEQLSSFNVKTNQINNKTNQQIEQYLKQVNNKISLVSVVHKGTNLIVNIKEKIQSNTLNNVITAPYNMEITKLNVKQGSTNYKVGDIVKKGETIVDGKTILSNGEVVNLQPIADVEGVSWVGGTVKFESVKQQLVRTGKSKSFTHFELFGKKLFYKTHNVKFEKFEKVVYNDCVFKNWILPINYTKTTYFELKEQTVTSSFDENKQDLINASKTEAYKNLPTGKTVQEENVVINKIDDTYFVSTYLKIFINL